jgi:hypothetical protein
VINNKKNEKYLHAPLLSFNPVSMHPYKKNTKQIIGVFPVDCCPFTHPQ